MRKTQWFYGYTLMVYSFVVCFLAASFFLHARGVFLPYWIEDFGVGRAELSLAVSITLISGSMTAPFMGYLIDHLKLRTIISCAAVWMGGGYMLMQFADSCHVGLACGSIATSHHRVHDLQELAELVAAIALVAQPGEAWRA